MSQYPHIQDLVVSSFGDQDEPTLFEVAMRPGILPTLDINPPILADRTHLQA